MKKSEVDSLVIGFSANDFGMRNAFSNRLFAGDVYFKTSRKDHNLDRCRTQLKLVSDMEKSDFGNVPHFISVLFCVTGNLYPHQECSKKKPRNFVVFSFVQNIFTINIF